MRAPRSLQCWFFNGPPDPGRARLFQNAHTGFQELRAAQESALHRALRTRQHEPAAGRFLHWAYCPAAAEPRYSSSTRASTWP